MHREKFLSFVKIEQQQEIKTFTVLLNIYFWPLGSFTVKKEKAGSFNTQQAVPVLNVSPVFPFL